MKYQIQQRTKTYAVNIIQLTERLPRTRTAEILSKQLIRSGTSVGANYRSACRDKSRADFISKMGIVEEELDETIYWLDLLSAIGLVASDIIMPLNREADELLAIVVSSIRTARNNARNN